MSEHFKRYTITSALPYANGAIHIGHLAGVYIPADIYARYLRSTGAEVLFIGGSDEHGVPITIKARQEHVSPQEVVDRYHFIIKKSFEELGISFDIYSRTSNSMHHQTASDFFLKLYNESKFIEKTSEQYYDEEAKQFLADRYIVGTCPHCNNERAYGDQCEQCGSSLNATDLINPKSVLSGSNPVLKETKHWYLPLGKYEEWLQLWILEGHKEWKSNVYGQCKSWIDQGLQPRAVTRDLDWGVKVPLSHAEGKVLYVWFDAPIGYISASKEWTKLTGKDWTPFWKDSHTKLVHFIGKDNIVFHCIIFPSMLKAEGSYILPENVPANEFLNLENDKISTSRNWAVWLHEYLEDFPEKQDVLRYVLTANAPETKDNNFTWKDFQERNNNELLAIFGNFINRSIVLVHKFFEGVVPEIDGWNDDDRLVIEEMAVLQKKVATNIENYRFREALNEMMNMARIGNKYLTDQEPWKTFKTNPERTKTILNLSMQICANLSIVCEPFLPFTAQKIRKMLNLPHLQWDQSGNPNLLQAGSHLSEPQLLFEKIEDSMIEAQIQRLQETKKANETQNIHIEPSKPLINYDDFAKLDIRIGTIIEAEALPKTKKLLKLKVNTGIDQRTIISGIADFFNPEKIIGQQVAVLINLEPKLLRGIQSNGMILMAENHDGTLSFVAPKEKITDGSSIK